MSRSYWRSCVRSRSAIARRCSRSCTRTWSSTTPVALPYGGVTRGKAEAREESRREETWIGTWARCSRRPPNAGWTRGWWRATAARWWSSTAIAPLSPAGERIDFPVLALYGVRDGKLARAQMFHYDTAALVRFLDRAQADRFTGARGIPGPIIE